MNHKTIFVILEDVAFCGYDPYKGYDAIDAYIDEYAKNKSQDDATTAAYRILRDDNYRPNHKGTRSEFPQYKVETEMSDSLSAAILNGEMKEKVIIGVDEGGYYTNDGYITDSEAVSMGLEVPHTDFKENWHKEAVEINEQN